MNKLVLAFLTFSCMHACKSSQKSNIQKSNKVFNESIANKEEKIMLQNGVDFFAEGNMPANWTLTMDYDDTVRFNADDGLTLKIAFNQLKKDVNKEQSIFSKTTKNGDISITVLNKDCSIQNTKEIFSKETTMRFNTIIYSGCGKFLADNLLNNKWIVERVGNSTVNATEYNIAPFFEFDLSKNRVSGNDGCKNFGAAIEIQGSRIKFGQFIQTQMGCNKNSMDKFIAEKLNNNFASYYFKESKLYLYLIDDSIIVLRKE
jgi:heat shock protein HslJ